MFFVRYPLTLQSRLEQRFRDDLPLQACELVKPRLNAVRIFATCQFQVIFVVASFGQG